jgi:hypothetical protein
MKNNLFVKTSLVLSFAAILFSCGSGSTTDKDTNESTATFRTVNFENLYSIEVPDYMEATRELNSEASLQFMNTSREAYVIVIHESKDEFVEAFREMEMFNEEQSILENYATFQKQTFTYAIDEETQNDPIEYLTINGLKAAVSVLAGSSSEIPFNIYYQFAFYEGKDTLYFLVAWTLSDNLSANKADLKTIAEGLKEL